jgi:RHS repeat-associated protein
LVTQLDYWPRGWLKSRNVGGLLTSFDYDGVGQLKKVTNPDASFVSYTYDPAHRLTDVTDTTGTTLHYTLDLMGNLTKEELKNSLGVSIASKNRQFDALSRLQKELNAANAEVANYAYDNNGNLKTATQKTTANVANDELTAYTYDPLNRLARVTGTLAGIADYAYSGLDQLTSVKDPRLLSTTYAVDGLDNLTTQASPDTGTTLNTYDAAGNVKTMKDANNTTVAYTYDALDRLTQKAVGTTVINYTYDSVVSGNFGNGRLTGMTDATGTTAHTYDLFGRVIRKTHTPASNFGSGALSVQYGYDSFGRMASITYPSGRVVNYAYSNGRVSALTLGATQTIASNIAYFGFATPASWTQGSGKAYSRSFDADGRIASYTNNTSQIALAYDLADNIGLLSDPALPANTKSFTYDKLNRLTGYGTNAGATSQGFAYDAVGNRQSTLVNGASTIYTSATTSNRLSSLGANAYGYSAAGNQTSAPSRTYAYDVFNRMSSATVSGVVTQYRYNGIGQRLYKGGANLSRFVYDEQGQLIGEYNNTGVMTREIVWFNDIPLAIMTPSGTATNLFYIDTDQLNTPRTITNQAKQKRWEWNSDPFGTTLANENPAALGIFTFNLRFPGQYFDKETGLHYNYFRDYNPAIGRYVQSDPIGLGGGLNTYAYVEGNPINRTDPTGRFFNPVIAANVALTSYNVYTIASSLSEYLRRNWIDPGLKPEFRLPPKPRLLDPGMNDPPAQCR